MDTIVVNKTELITTLTENLEQHRSTYEKAMEGYKKAATAWLQSTLDSMLKGEVNTRLLFDSPVPQDHSTEYEQLIEMLTWDQADTVELRWDEFTQYVRDEWGWKKQWSAANSTYGVG